MLLGERKSVAAPLQEAMYARASTDQMLGELTDGQIFDEVPEQLTYPYVVIGEAIESPFDAHDRYGAKTDLAWHIWSDYRGFLQGNRIGGRLQELFNRRPLEIPGHRLVVCKFRQQTPMRDPNPQLRHVVVRFQAITEQL